MFAPLTPQATQSVIGFVADAGRVGAADGSWLGTVCSLARPTFIALAIRETGRALSRNLLLLAQAQRFDERPAAVRELMALEEMLRLVRANRRLAP